MRLRVLLAVVAVLLGLVACERGGIEDLGPVPTDSSAANEGDDGTCEPGDPRDPALTVTIAEHDIRMEEDELTRGPQRFRVLNSSKEVHDTYLIEARAIQGIPLTRKGEVDIEALEEDGRVFGHLEGITSGKSCDLDVELDPGTYVLLCDIRERTDAGVVNHFLQGERVRFKVV